MKHIIQQIFSVKNEGNYKVLRLLGIKFKTKNKYKMLQDEVGFMKQEVKQEVYDLKNSSSNLHNEIYFLRNCEFETANSIWRTWGTTPELLSHLTYLAQAPYQWDIQNNAIWLIYISCLIETKKQDEALNILKKYVDKHGLKDIERYLPVANFAYQNGFENDDIKKASFVFEKLEENRKNKLFEKLIEGKTVAIVGNGPSEIGKGKGEEIDSHDIVIRFNNYQIEGYEKDYGTRTDVWVRGSGGNDVEDRTSGNIYSFVMWEADYSHFPVHFDHLYLLYRDLSSIQCANFDYKTHLNARLVSRINFPTTGLICMYHLLNSGAKTLDLYGFSFLQEIEDGYATHYFNDRDEKEARERSECHNFDKESVYLKELFKNKQNKINQLCKVEK